MSDFTNIENIISDARNGKMYILVDSEDAEHDDERPTPNAHRKTTSSVRGPTDVDPEDDPRYWGTHPIGIVARRGHM